MKAVTCQNSKLELVDLPDPRPGRGQVVINVLGCGICGSDLHVRYHADAEADVLAEIGYNDFARSASSVVFGHEFVGEVAEYGAGTRKKIATGTPVVAVPLTRRPNGTHAIGLSASAPGGYAEQVVVEESLMFALPNGLSPKLAVLTEPLAVGWHAVRRAEIKKNDVAIVIGCGPVGLAVICMLKARGVATVVASDFAPGRRRLAVACGADIVVDPAVDSPYTAPAGARFLTSLPAVVDLGIGTMEKLRPMRVPWEHVWRLGERLGGRPKRPVVFECVGVPGMLDGIIASAPLFARVVVAGVCMQPDTIRPVMAINKEIDLRFVMGYSPLEFSETLRMLAAGKVNAAPIATGTVGLPGVEAAFNVLSDPGEHAKIIIEPASEATEPVAAALARRARHNGAPQRSGAPLPSSAEADPRRRSPSVTASWLPLVRTGRLRPVLDHLPSTIAARHDP